MILVTGAAGHIGNVLVRELLGRGANVRALILPGEDVSSLEGLDVELVEGNILDLPSLAPAFAGIDQVYHLAGMISILPDSNGIVRRVNVEGTRNVLEAARRAGVRRLVYTSSIHALGRPPLGVTIDETMPFDPNNTAGEYDATKAEASLLVIEAAKNGLDAVLVCPTGVIGPYDYRLSEMGNLVKGWMHRGLHLLVDGMYDFVDVRDVARGHILAMEKGRSGEVYILSGQRIRLAEIKELVQQHADSRSPGIQIPMPLALFFTIFTPFWYKLTHATPRFTRYSLETVMSNSFISSAKAIRELGYTARSMGETIGDTVRWWRQYLTRKTAPLRVKSRR